MNDSVKLDDASINCNRFSPEAQREILLQPYTYITKTNLPKVWRKLGKAYNGWLNISEKNLQELENVFEMHQYCFLLFDDMQDGRDFRDGLPSAYSVYGMAHNITTYIYVLVKAKRELHTLSIKFDKADQELLKQTTLARSMELFWSDTVCCPTEEEYYAMVIQKTYLLLTSKIKCMQIWSTNERDFVKLSGMFGLYFQILDDYRRLTSKDENCSSYLEDVTLAKFSLPIIHAIRTQPKKGAVILDILRKRTTETDVKKYVVTLLKRFGSFVYTKNTLEQLKQAIIKTVSEMETNCIMNEFIKEHLDYSSDIDQDSEITSTVNNSISSFIAQMSKPQNREKIGVQVKRILKPLTHVQSVPGKHIRVTFTRILNKWLKASEDKVAIIEFIIDNLHEASLLLDDIQDNSDLRRGIPTAHKIYGIGNTINAATYIIAESIAKLISLDPRAVDMYLHLAELILRGQGMDIYWRDSCVCPTESEYIDVISGKTATPFILIGRLLALFSSTKKSPERLTLAVGNYFQINDDYQNLTNQIFYDSKGFCEDLTEGKFGFPVVHAINSHPKEGQLIMDILRKRTHDFATKKICLSLIEKCGSFEYTKSKLKELREIISEEITDYGDSINVLEFLEKEMFVPSI